ncbi:MAG: hypothetical protein ACXVHW_09695, partial [Methanobacterium sp.]
MNKSLMVISMIFILVLSISATTGVVMGSDVNNNLPVIYITSDKLVSDFADKEMLNKIKNAIDGSANV